MRVKKIQLKNFKRFDDLTINLGEAPKKVVAMVGPNGCGKSSVFDAFEERLKLIKGSRGNEESSFYNKLHFSRDKTIRSSTYDRNRAIIIDTTKEGNKLDKKSFHIRSPYRFTSKLRLNSIKRQEDILTDESRPNSSIALDNRLTENYERLVNEAFSVFFNEGSTETGSEARERIVGEINEILSGVLDVRISNIGNIIEGRGCLYFEKENSINFPYDVLSSGEKEVVDIIIDLVIRTKYYDDTVYCIDEPELHINTAIQKRLLVEIEKLIPENCQLWVATHSIGFLKALQDELQEKSQILDFSEKNYFSGTQTLVPTTKSRKNWLRIFETALEDLTGLLSPERIIYCEGSPIPNANGEEQGIDAQAYNIIFETTQNDTLFVSGGGDDVISNSSLAIKVLSKAFRNVEILRLKDRDDLSSDQRDSFLAEEEINRMLLRREFENYIFDQEILQKYCTQNSRSFNETEYQKIVTNPQLQDLKTNGTCGQLKNLCRYSSTKSIKDFILDLSKLITPDTSIYKELVSVIFQKTPSN